MNPGKYINRMQTMFQRHYPNDKLSEKISSPLEPGDHPKLDTSEFLDPNGTEIYQSWIGSFQWAVTINW